MSQVAGKNTQVYYLHCRASFTCLIFIYVIVGHCLPLSNSRNEFKLMPLTSSVHSSGACRRRKGADEPSSSFFGDKVGFRRYRHEGALAVAPSSQPSAHCSQYRPDMKLLSSIHIMPARPRSVLLYHICRMMVKVGICSHFQLPSSVYIRVEFVRSTSE